MSGCSNNTGRPANIMPDTGVKYTGPDIESLGICQGSYLDQVEAVILNLLQNFAAGQGITLDDLDFDQCDFLKSFVTCCVQDKSLDKVMAVVLKALCQLKGSIDTLTEEVTEVQTGINFTITPGCLTVANTKIDTVLNALITAHCDFKAKVTNIFGGDLDNPVFNTTILNQVIDTVLSTVISNMQGCSPGDVTKTGTGVNTQIKINGIVPKGGMLFGKWDASYFDNTGLGLASKGMCGWAVANGNNGTDDWRGFTPAMATNISGPGSLNPIVDPVAQGDADLGTNVGDIKGAAKVKLTGAESGTSAHTHGITQTPHTHTVPPYDRLLSHDGTKTLSDNDNNDPSGSEPRLDKSAVMAPANANITINPSTEAPAIKSHENRQPTRYVNCIQRIV